MAALGLGNPLGNPLVKPTTASTSVSTTAVTEPSWDELVYTSVVNGQSSNQPTTMCVLSSDKVLVQTSSANSVTTQVWSITGKTISAGTAAGVSSNTQQHNTCSLTSDTAISINYDATTDSARARVITVAGTVPTVQSYTEVEASGTSIMFGLAKIDSTRALWVYRYNNTGFLTARVLTNSSNTLVAGARNALNSNPQTYQCHVTCLSSTKALAVYRDNSTQRWNAMVLTISGDTVTAGSTVEQALTVTGSGNAYNSLIKTTDNQAAFLFCDSSAQPRLAIIDVVDTTPTWVAGASPLNIDNTASIGDNGVSLGLLSPGVIIANCVGATSYAYAHKIALSGSTPTAIIKKAYTTASSSMLAMGCVTPTVSFMVNTQSSVQRSYAVKAV